MLYTKLRGALTERDMLQSDLGKRLGLSQQSVSLRMTGRIPWTIPEAYKVLDILGLSPKSLPAYFPPGGKALDVEPCA